jgi:putative transposase
VRGEEANHAVARLCQAMEVSRSGYYAWRRRREGPRARANRRLTTAIREIYEGSRGAYGAPRIHLELHVRGEPCGRHRVARLMRQAGLAGRRRRRFRNTTKASPRLPVAPNLLAQRFLAQRFTAERPNAVWVADITYVPTREGWL